MKFIKLYIKKMVFSNKTLSKLYFMVVYKNLKKELLVSKILQIAHRIDHQFIGNTSICKKDIYEIEFLIKEAIKKKIKFNDSLMWCLAIYSLAKLKGNDSYYTRDEDETRETVKSDLSKLIMDRRSIRKWTKEEIDKKLIKNILYYSIWAPSSCNRQSVRIIILNDSQKVFMRKYFSGTFWYEAPIQLLILNNKKIYNANEKGFLYLDSGAYIQNVLLLLHEAGLGACWLGFKKWNDRDEYFCEKNDVEDFYAYFNISQDYIPVSMVVAGYYDKKANKPARIDIDTLLIGDDIN